MKEQAMRHCKEIRTYVPSEPQVCVLSTLVGSMTLNLVKVICGFVPATSKYLHHHMERWVLLPHTFQSGPSEKSCPPPSPSSHRSRWISSPPRCSPQPLDAQTELPSHNGSHSPCPALACCIWKCQWRMSLTSCLKIRKISAAQQHTDLPSLLSLVFQEKILPSRPFFSVKQLRVDFARSQGFAEFEFHHPGHPSYDQQAKGDMNTNLNG